MKTTKRVCSLMLALFLLLSTVPVATFAASSWPSLSERCYAEYKVPGRVNVYADAKLAKRGTESPYREYGAYLDPGDLIYIYSISATSCRIKYPAGSTYKIGYVSTSTLLGCTAPAQYTSQSRAKVTTYTDLGKTTSGYVAVNDEFYRLGSAQGGEYILGCYTAKNSSGRGWKIAFVKTSDYAAITGSSGGAQVTSFTAYVKTSNPNNSLKMRSAASTSASVVTKLPYGTQVKVISTHNDWAKVSANGKTGYVASRYLSKTKPSSTVSTTENGVKYLYKTVTLDTSSLSAWMASMMNAQDKAGGIIVSQTVNEYRTMKVVEPLQGPPVNGKSPTRTTTIQAPYKVTLKVHTHERTMGFGASVRYANGCIITMYSCKCGYTKDLLVWEIPLPDPSEFANKQITETIQIQARQYTWINNMK